MNCVSSPAIAPPSIHERANEVNRLQKVLEGANIKLASVATDILGKSGRDMLEALVGGSTDVAALAQLARGRMREKIPQLEQALAGQFGPHQRFLIAQQLAHIDFLDASLERVSAEIGDRLRPFEPRDGADADDPGRGPAHCRDRSSPRSARISPASPVRATLRPGPGCVPATTRVPANAEVGARAKAVPGCAPPWSKPHGPPRAPKTPIWPRSIDGWRRAEEPNARR